MSNFMWQISWSSWRLSKHKIVLLQDEYGTTVYANFLIVGPLQIRWFSS